MPKDKEQTKPIVAVTPNDDIGDISLDHRNERRAEAVFKRLGVSKPKTFEENAARIKAAHGY